MPELPEIEHLKRSLEPALLGSAVESVTVHRRDVIRRSPTWNAAQARFTRGQLLAGRTITQLARRGKQLAILTGDGPALCIHLGMSGQLRYLAARQRLTRNDHVHCQWRLRGPSGQGRLIFRDPRRFGGIWSFPSARELLTHHWAKLGPDALTITPAQLQHQLLSRQRSIKAALLDQHLLAGVGNIYADEALFAAKVHPLTPCSALTGGQFRTLQRHLVRILHLAADSRGSTLRDYADANGQAGSFASRHQVYGRADQPCTVCGCTLLRTLVAQRTTVYCPNCQSVQT